MNKEPQKEQHRGKGFTEAEIASVWEAVELLSEILTSNRICIIDRETGPDEKN